MSNRTSHRLRGVVFLLVACSLCGMATRDFLTAHTDEPLFPVPGAKRKHLADYFPSLRGTRADSDVFIIEGKEPGGTVLVLGGTHPNEVAGFLAAYILIENAQVKRGRLIVIPRANHSAFTHTEPGEALPARFEIKTPRGPRTFRVGCRFTNPLDQWPDPEVYLHHPSGQQLSGNETRNMNRAYPGRADGDFTERAAFAVTELVKREHVDLVIDLHESSPEYPVINAIVAHERAMDIAALANLTLQSEGLDFSLEPSPVNFHGLTHRELGDATPAFAVLLESANIMQGRLRGRTTAAKILSGKDEWYTHAARANLLRVPYDSTGIPIETRVGRHLAGIRALTDALTALSPDRGIGYDGIPLLTEMQTGGVGKYLARKIEH
jgi:hypothetical protein